MEIVRDMLNKAATSDEDEEDEEEEEEEEEEEKAGKQSCEVGEACSELY